MRRALFSLAILVAISAVGPLGAASRSAAPPTLTKIVRTGPGPCGATAAGRGLWVGVYSAGTLLRMTSAGVVTRRFVVGRTACRVAVGSQYAWVTRDGADELVRVHLGTGKLDRIEVGRVPFDVLRAAGSIWVTNWESGTVTRVDARRGIVLDTISVGARPTGLAACGGRIWVGHGRTARALTSIDPKTLRLRRVSVGVMPEWPHCIGGALWLTSPSYVLRLRARSGRVQTRLRIGDTLADAALGSDGLVWVTDKQHAVVHRVTIDGRTVMDTFSAGPGAFALARLGSSMWVTSFAGNDVRRFDAD